MRVRDRILGIRVTISSSLHAGHRKEDFAVHGLREVSIRLRLHLYCPPAGETQRSAGAACCWAHAQKTGAI